MTVSDRSQGNVRSKTRIRSILILILSCFTFYTLYLFNTQIIRGYEYRNRARQVSSREIPIPAQRGEIYDRNMDVPLVMNIPSFAVDIIPAEVSDADLEELISRLSLVLNVEEAVIQKRLPDSYRHLYQPIELKSGVNFETISYIAENLNRFPGVTWHETATRSYLETGSIAHILGYVGSITSEELQVLYNQGYDYNSVLGKSGIENQYDQILRGTDGRQYRIVDVRGKRIEEGGFEEVPPVNGNTIVLTIDRNIQKLCEKALGERLGSVVVLRPTTGEILAMVSYPYYDPNIFYTSRESEELRRISLDPNSPFLNRAIRSSYAPASTFKIIMTAAILEEGVFPPEQKITCEGNILVGNRIFNCHKKTGHGPLDLAGALAESCDVYFWTIGRRYLGVETIADYARRFGFGDLTGIDLSGEVRGLVPTPQWKENTYHSRWVGGDTINMSIGQGYLEVTPLQMANMVAKVVNSGIIMKPHLLKEIRDPVTGELIDSIEPEILHTTTLRPETFATLKQNMRGVITRGTAHTVITTKAVTVAGKTGTGEVGLDARWNSWFVAYAPYDVPPEEQIVIVTMVEAANEWEWWAPKAANIILQGIYANQTYEEALLELGWQYLEKPKGRRE
jgi:penicillin-binding protein 2